MIDIQSWCAAHALVMLSGTDQAELQTLYEAEDSEGARTWGRTKARTELGRDVEYHVALTIQYALENDDWSPRSCIEHYVVARGYAADLAIRNRDGKMTSGTMSPEANMAHVTAKMKALEDVVDQLVGER